MALLSNPVNCSRGFDHQGWCQLQVPEASAQLLIHWGSCFPSWSQRDISWPQLILQRSYFVHGAVLARRGPRAACDDLCCDSAGPNSRGCQNTVHLIQPPAIPSGCPQSMRKFEIQAYSVSVPFVQTWKYIKKKQLGRGWQRATTESQRKQKGSSCLLSSSTGLRATS